MDKLPESGAYVIVAGCGRLGRQLAAMLSRQGHSVVAIDCQPRALDRLADGFSGFRLIGDVVEPSILQQAQIAEADLVLATTGSDTANLLVALSAQQLHRVRRVLARVRDKEWEEIFERASIETICPSTLVIDEVGKLLGLAGTEDES